MYSGGVTFSTLRHTKKKGRGDDVVVVVRAIGMMAHHS